LDLVGRAVDTITGTGKASMAASTIITAGTASASEITTAGASMNIANTNETAITTIANADF
jgi:hypothetical protein